MQAYCFATAPDCPSRLLNFLVVDGNDSLSYERINYLKFISNNKDDSYESIIDELGIKVTELQNEIIAIIKKNGTAENIKYPRHIVSELNETTRTFQKLLNENGVQSRTVLSRVNPEFLNLEILSASNSAPKAFQLYLRGHKKFRGSELVVSNFENTLIGASARYSSATNTVDIGLDALIDGLKNQTHPYALHELRHLLKTAKQKTQTDLFSLKFFASNKVNLLGEKTKSLDMSYSNSLHAQEIYTMSSDHRVLGAKLYNETNPEKKAILIKTIQEELTALLHISKRIYYLTENFMSPQEVNLIYNNGAKKILLLDKYKRSAEINLTLDEIEVYERLNVDKLLPMLSHGEQSQFRYDLSALKDEPFSAKKTSELIRNTLKKTVLIPKALRHNDELHHLSNAQIQLILKARAIINTANFSSTDLTQVLHQIALNTR